VSRPSAPSGAPVREVRASIYPQEQTPLNCNYREQLSNATIGSETDRRSLCPVEADAASSDESTFK
jgi:hypothetical protein